MSRLNGWVFVLSGRVFESRFCPHIFDQLGKWLDQKDKVHFKIYDVFYQETNNYTAHIAQYLKK